jgi:hypothetical protein
MADPFDKFKEKLKWEKGKQASPEHSALISHVKKLISKSRTDMAKNFTKWDNNDDVFRSRRILDKADRAAEAKGQPKKLIVPLTFAQIMTFVSFCVMSVMQNRRFFELEPTGTEDNPLDEPMELILERDLRRNTWTSFLVQFFLNIGRFSLAAAEVCYKEDYRYMRIPQTETEQGAFGVETNKQTYDFQKIPTFIGNKVYSVSPYSFLPDTRLPLTRFQEGEFCASENQFSMATLRNDDSLFNLDVIPKITIDQYRERRKVSRIDLGADDHKNPNLGSGEDSGTGDGFVKSGPIVITKVVVDLVPNDFKVQDKEGELGTEKFPVRYLMWYANDKVIIRFEEAYYLHCQFPYICAQYLPDEHQNINEGLADICDQMTNLITWLINAHVTSQRNSVQSKWIVDPAGVDVKSLESESPYIFLKRNASQTGIDRYIKQFETKDTTANVMQDVGSLKELLEIVTGLSSQMQGQYSQGRRSATQDRVVAQGASARGKTSLSTIWDAAFEPLGKQLIANNRQEMDKETFLRIMGKRQWPVNPDIPPQVDPMTGASVPTYFTDDEIFTMFKADPITIATSEDFFVFDGTLPSEKAFLAQSMQEILVTILQNPDVASILGYGPEQVKELFQQIYLLRGVTPARLPAPSPQPAQPPEGGQQAGPEPPPAPRELITVKLPDLAGKERDQALAMFGIKADSPAADKKLKMENPPPTPKSNGQRG